MDFLIAQPEVDRRRLALMGMSMGGALVPRAAAFEQRLKIIIANPGVLNWGELLHGLMREQFGEQLYGLLEQDPPAFDAGVAKLMRGSAFLRWAVRDMLWKHGISSGSPSELMASLKTYDNTDSVARITARTLVMDGTADLWAQGKPLYDAVKAPKDYMLFTAKDTGLKHVQPGALAVSSQRLFDWLDEHI